MDFQTVSRVNRFMKGRFLFVFDKSEAIIALGRDMDIDMAEYILKNEWLRLLLNQGQ